MWQRVAGGGGGGGVIGRHEESKTKKTRRSGCGLSIHHFITPFATLTAPARTTKDRALAQHSLSCHGQGPGPGGERSGSSRGLESTCEGLEAPRWSLQSWTLASSGAPTERGAD